MSALEQKVAAKTSGGPLRGVIAPPGGQFVRYRNVTFPVPLTLIPGNNTFGAIRMAPETGMGMSARIMSWSDEAASAGEEILSPQIQGTGTERGGGPGMSWCRIPVRAESDGMDVDQDLKVSVSSC
jgi:hypothetical protein